MQHLAQKIVGLVSLSHASSHWDHTGGNAELKKDGVQVYGPATESIPGRDHALSGGDSFAFGHSQVQVLDVGGHTNGHIAYVLDGKAFVGDALFALGCGRMFEGTPSQFWASLQRLRALPDETVVYCAHEYTLSNAKFAVSVEPSNVVLQERFVEIQKLREQGLPTVPSLLGVEKATNPFLRCDVSAELRQKVGVVEGDSDAVAFGKVRKAKDNF